VTGGVTVQRLSDRVIHAGRNADSPREARAKVRKDVPVEVLAEQHVELGGPQDKLHRHVVDYHLIQIYFLVLRMHLPCAFQEKPIRQLHYVRLVDRGDFAPAHSSGVLKGESGDIGGATARYTLDAFSSILVDPPFHTDIQVLDILPHDDDVHAFIP